MARKPQDNPQLDMTPMIDVVFELIIFFVVTIKQEDILSRLNVNRPQGAVGNPTPSDDITFKIEVGRRDMYTDREGSYVYNGNPVTLNDLDKYLKNTAAVSTDTPIIITCSMDSPHKALVDLLDICYKYKLYSVSVFSL